MMISYKITSVISDDVTLTVSANACEEIGTRKDEYNNSIPITRCRPVCVNISSSDLPKVNTLAYVKERIEAAYAGLSDETLVRLLLEKKWTQVPKK